MIDVKSCKNITLRGQEVKKITDHLGRILYEKSGPGPTPTTYHDFSEDSLGTNVLLGTPVVAGIGKKITRSYKVGFYKDNSSKDLIDWATSYPSLSGLLGFDAHIEGYDEEIDYSETWLVNAWNSKSYTDIGFSGDSIYYDVDNERVVIVSTQWTLINNHKIQCVVTGSIQGTNYTILTITIDNLLIESEDVELTYGTYTLQGKELTTYKKISSICLLYGDEEIPFNLYMKARGTCQFTFEDGYTFKSYKRGYIGCTNGSQYASSGGIRYFTDDAVANEIRWMADSTKKLLYVGCYSTHFKKTAGTSVTINKVEWDSSTCQLKCYESTTNLVVTIQFPTIIETASYPKE